MLVDVTNERMVNVKIMMSGSGTHVDTYVLLTDTAISHIHLLMHIYV